MSHPNLLIRSLTPDWDSSALRRLGEILFRTSPLPKRTRQIDTFVDLIQTGQLKRDNILLAFQYDLLVGAILAETMPGASGNLWLPQVIVSQSILVIEDALIREALRRFRLDGVKSVQAFLSAEELPVVNPLPRHGFRPLTRVWTMGRGVGSSEFVPFTVEFQPANLPRRSTFLDTLIRTYDGSLDCPELNEARTPDEIRDGFLSSATDLDLWWLLRSQEEDAGVLILTRDGDRCEINYLGVVPQFRRGGIATQAVRFALRQAEEKNATELTLLVDSRNQPAIELYRRHGFGIRGSRDVFLWSES